MNLNSRKPRANKYVQRKNCSVAAITGALTALTVFAATMPAASAGSVTQPGETIGIATGAPLPEGWYALDTIDYGQRTPPSNI